MQTEQVTAESYAASLREIRNIGTGSFGSAFLVERVGSHERLVAKKISLAHLAEAAADKAKLEASLLRSLRHPNITTYFGSFVTGGVLHIVMEYCSGGSLQQVRRSATASPPPTRAKSTPTPARRTRASGGCAAAGLT